jgi:hypothetical protein
MNLFTELVLCAIEMAIGIFAFVVLYEIVMRSIYGYRINVNGIDILFLGRFILKKISFSDITQIKRNSLNDTLSPKIMFAFDALHLGFGKKIVFLHIAKGFKLPLRRDKGTLHRIFIYTNGINNLMEQLIKREIKRDEAT